MKRNKTIFILKEFAFNFFLAYFPQFVVAGYKYFGIIVMAIVIIHI